MKFLNGFAHRSSAPLAGQKIVFALVLHLLVSLVNGCATTSTSRPAKKTAATVRQSSHATHSVSKSNVIPNDAQPTDSFALMDDGKDVDSDIRSCGSKTRGESGF